MWSERCFLWFVGTQCLVLYISEPLVYSNFEEEKEGCRSNDLKRVSNRSVLGCYNKRR